MGTPSASANFFPQSQAMFKQMGMGLPFIRGTWFFVDPVAGSDSNDGLSVDTAFANIKAAYAACTSNVGDGIAVLSSDADTVANTTSYLKERLTWAKNSITVFGVCAPTRQFQRARIESKVVTTGAQTTLSFLRGVASPDTINRSAGSFITNGFEAGQLLRVVTTGTGANGTGFIIASVTATTITLTTTGTLVTETAANAGSSTVSSYCPSLISVTGANNSFHNLLFVHLGADALDVNCLKVSGARNYFQNVHAGVGVADANTTITKSLWLAAAEENTFKFCTFGLDTVDRGGVATYDIYLAGAVARNLFEDCVTVRQSGTGTGCLAVYADTTTGGRPTMFVRCIFTCWNTAGGNANCSYLFGSTGNCDFAWFVKCTWPGYGNLSNDAVAYSDSVLTGNVNSGVMYT